MVPSSSTTCRQAGTAVRETIITWNLYVRAAAPGSGFKKERCHASYSDIVVSDKEFHWLF